MMKEPSPVTRLFYSSNPILPPNIIRLNTMENLPPCKKCKSEYTYQDSNLYICPECAHEWAVDSQVEESPETRTVTDAHGNVLKDGDSVTVIKDLRVKGSSLVVKVGVKVKDIRIVEEQHGGHDIDCKIKGMGEMMLKSKFVKKCT